MTVKDDENAIDIYTMIVSVTEPSQTETVVAARAYGYWL